MLAPANYCFLHQELCFFVCLQPVKMLHGAALEYLYDVASTGHKDNSKCYFVNIRNVFTTWVKERDLSSLVLHHTSGVGLPVT